MKNCAECMRKHSQPKEPMKPSCLPSYPWERVGVELFELRGPTYLLVVDYYLRYPEVISLTSTTSSRVITSLKSVFACFGTEVVSDNGPQFSSEAFHTFASKYCFQHVTSSPHYPQSNGLVKRKVQTVKHLLNNSTDQHSALLSYRATPLPWCGRSPAELLMGRCIRTDIPQTPD